MVRFYRFDHYTAQSAALKKEARRAPTPITTYTLFHDGKYLTNEQMNAAKFLKLITE